MVSPSLDGSGDGGGTMHGGMHWCDGMARAPLDSELWEFTYPIRLALLLSIRSIRRVLSPLSASPGGWTRWDVDGVRSKDHRFRFHRRLPRMHPRPEEMMYPHRHVWTSPQRRLLAHFAPIIDLPTLGTVVVQPSSLRFILELTPSGSCN